MFEKNTGSSKTHSNVFRTTNLINETKQWFRIKKIPPPPQKKVEKKVSENTRGHMKRKSIY
jgi:hypothetical protein